MAASLDPKLEIRKLKPSIIKEFSLILDSADSWKKLMALIPKVLGSTGFRSDITIGNPPKYNSEHFKIIEDVSTRYNRSCTEILFDEWGTSGKIRCSLGHLKYLLTKAELFRAADYVSELLGEEPPPRPEIGPAAKITIDPSELVDPANAEFEKHLNEINYPQMAIQQIRRQSLGVKPAVSVIPEIVVSEVRPEPETFRLPVVVPKPKPQPPELSDMMKFSEKNVDCQQVHVKENNASLIMPEISFLLEQESTNSESIEDPAFTPAFSQILPDSPQTNTTPSIIQNQSTPEASSIATESSIESDLIPAVSALNQEMPQLNIQSDFIPDFGVLQSEISSNIPLTIPQLASESKSSDYSSTKCPSPLPVLSLNTELPHFNYSALEAKTENFSLDKENGRFLGAGAFGSVFLAVGLLDRPVAVKKMNLENEEEVKEGDDVTKQFKNEVEILYKYKHENLVSLLGYSCDGSTYCLVYEYVSGGSLLEMIQKHSKNLSDKQRLHIALGTANAIAYLHTAFSTPLIHRDIKSANILLDAEKNAKLCDFGIIKLLPGQTADLQSVPCGTSAYMAPEYHLGEISVKLDTYSFGVVLLELLTSLPPLDYTREPADLVSYVEDHCEDSIEQFLDKSSGPWQEKGIDYGNELYRLTLCCLNDKESRPVMADIAKSIENIQRDLN